MDVVDLSIKLNLNVPAESLRNIAEDVYELVDTAQASFLGLENPEIHVWVEQGSLNYRTKIIAALNIMFVAVSGYGGFIDGVEKIYEHSKKVINYVNEKLIESTPSKVLESKRSAGFPEKVKLIMRSVQQGKLTPDQATEKLIKLLEAEEGDSDLKESIVVSFRQSAKAEFRTANVQLEAFPSDDFKIESKTSPVKKPTSKPPLDEASLQGVELWYNRRTGIKEIRTYIK